MITKIRAEFAFTIPAGISLMMVLGFLASISLSSHLLNAMAALLANNIHKITNNKVFISKPAPWMTEPDIYPTKAKGKAKMVWLNLIRER